MTIPERRSKGQQPEGADDEQVMGRVVLAARDALAQRGVYFSFLPEALTAKPDQEPSTPSEAKPPNFLDRVWAAVASDDTQRYGLGGFAAALLRPRKEGKQ